MRNVRVLLQIQKRIKASCASCLLSIRGVILLLITIVSVQAQTIDSVKILFVGNSYVYYNNLPTLFALLAESGGKKVTVGSSAIGSYRLIDHAGNSTTLSLIAQQWNMVVLQEQSVLPVIQFLRDAMMYPAARFLDSLIRERGASTLFYMTWGRKYGGTFSLSGYRTINFQDYHHMQDSLTSAYREVAGKLQARVIPVGIAWKNAILEDPSADLWISDYSHPTLKGSYLAACTFYAAVFNASPVGLTYTVGLSAADAAFLQKHAAATLTFFALSNEAMPSLYHLAQNYPNPFNPETKIKYEIKEASLVRLAVHNILGREVAVLVNEEKPAGKYDVKWDASKIASGIYFYTLQAGIFRETKRMMLIK
jgi:hypothetical protein